MKDKWIRYKIKVYWFLMFWGIWTRKMSSTVHRLYNNLPEEEKMKL